ncbi:MAG: ATPase [Acidobacteria bacterium]|nr:ATPase [Acidobacteriota bacterium]
MSGARCYLGVDGGQTHTTAVIGDEAGHVLGYGHAGPSNYVGEVDRRDRFVEAVTAAVDLACDQAGLRRANVTFDAACLGFTGGAIAKEPLVRHIVAASTLRIVDDATIALSGALEGGSGVVMIAGTGSMCFGRNGDRTARAGGWGYVFGDEGAAFDITRQALRAATRYEEGWGPFTVLHERFRAATGVDDIHEMRRRFYAPEFPRDRIAGYSRLVDEAAEAGDPVAMEILDDAAKHLAGFVAVVRQRLFDVSEPVRVAYVGGVFRSRRVLEAFRRRVEAISRTTVIAPRHGPEIGALIEAYRAAGLDVTPAPRR